MNGLPLHPAIVHFPLVLAMMAPMVLGALTWALWRGRIGRRGWLIGVALQALIVGGGLLGLRTGEADEHAAERVVAESAIEAHEEKAEVFVSAAAVVLAAAVAAALVPRAVARILTPAVSMGALAVAMLGLSVGHAGGELVYRYGAAAAHVNAGSQAVAAGAEQARSGDGDDD